MKKYNVTVNGEAFVVEVEEIGAAAPVAAAPVAAAPVAAAPVAAAPVAAAPAKPQAASADGTPILCPLAGTVAKVVANVGQSVKSGETVIVIDAMKMENEIVAPCDGVVKAVNYAVGNPVQADDVLMVI